MISNDIILFFLGILSGFVNIVGGGGSILIVPTLIFFGMPAQVANATNRLAILVQNIVGIFQFQRDKIIDWKGSLWLSVPAVLGSVIGSFIAVDVDEELFKKILAYAMLCLVFFLFTKPKKWLDGSISKLSGIPQFKNWIIFFGIGVYGGFLQIGVGFLLLTALVLSVGYNLKYANPIKIVVVLLYTIISVIIFVYYDLVEWKAGISICLGNAIGGWLGAKFSTRFGSQFIRWFLIVIIILFAFELIGIIHILNYLIGI